MTEHDAFRHGCRTTCNLLPSIARTVTRCKPSGFGLLGDLVAWHVIVADPGSGKTMGIKDLDGVLRFPSHGKHKTRPPVTSQRWTMEKPIWEVVRGERK